MKVQVHTGGCTGITGTTVGSESESDTGGYTGSTGTTVTSEGVGSHVWLHRDYCG